MNTSEQGLIRRCRYPSDRCHCVNERIFDCGFSVATNGVAKMSIQMGIEIEIDELAIWAHLGSHFDVEPDVAGSEASGRCWDSETVAVGDWAGHMLRNFRWVVLRRKCQLNHGS